MKPHGLFCLQQFVALELGCQLMTETEVTDLDWDSDQKRWKISAKSGNEVPEKVLFANSVVNCTGNYSDEINEKNQSTEDFRLII